MAIALGHPLRAAQLLLEAVAKAEGAAEFINHCLPRRRVVATGRLVADTVGRHPVGIHVATGQRRAGFLVGQDLFLEPRAARTGGGSVRRERQRRRDRHIGRRGSGQGR